MLIQKQFSIKWLSVAMIMCLMFSLNSCLSDDNDTAPSHWGIWERIDSSEEGSVKQVLVITASNLRMTMSLLEEDEWLDMMLVEGTYSVSGNIFTLTITRIGILNDEMTGFDYYTPDDFEWDLVLEGEFEIEESFEVKFEVSGNQLTIISDDNGDGIFDPIEESETFTKV